MSWKASFFFSQPQPYWTCLFASTSCLGKSDLCSNYYYLLLGSFSHQFLLMVFHRTLIDSKCPPVSRTLLTILAVLNNAVVWMVSTRPPTFKSSSPFYNPLVSVPKVTITIAITVIFMFQRFFHFLARSRYISFITFSLSFIQFIQCILTARPTILQVLFRLLIII